MSKAKRKHKRDKRHDLDYLFEKFTLYTCRLMAHPYLNDKVRSFLLDMANDITSEYSNSPRDWAVSNRYSLPRALRNAQAGKEPS